MEIEQKVSILCAHLTQMNVRHVNVFFATVYKKTILSEDLS